MRIAATLITLNEEANLPRAVASLGVCDEIVVVDSGSTDRTVEIARAAGAKVLHNPWPGYAAQKNFAAQSADCEWILALDADEELSPQLQREIAELKRSGPEQIAYSFPRLARYAGRWIRHSGWYPDRKVRLYRRDKGRWVGDYVHESVEVDEPAGRLEGELLHYTCDSLSEHLLTLDRYTSLAAEELRARGRRSSFLRLTVSPLWASFRSYVLQRGFLDGLQGLQIAAMAGLYVYAKYAKLRELESRS